MDPALQDRVRDAAAVLRRGGLVAYPTETFYGIGALADRHDALARLVDAKLRPAGKPLPLLAADRALLDPVCRFSALADRLAARFWPGPLTLVLPAAPGLAEEITAGTGTVGVRVPGSDIARELSRLAGGALVATSANVSGGEPVTRVADLDRALVARLDAVLDGGPAPGGRPSTVVAVEGAGVRLVRAGAVSFDAVASACSVAEE